MTHHTIDDITAKTDGYVLKTYGRRPLAFERGDGVTLYDADGTTYLDCNSGLGVNALGHNNAALNALITAQVGRVIHTSNLYHIPAQAALAEKIVARSFGEKVFFCNSGTEAVEGALKFARKWGRQFATPKTGIIAFSNSFHGRTMGALSLTMQAKYQQAFAPLLPGVTEASFNDAASFDAAVSDTTAAVIIEPIQGEGGVNPADPAFMTHVAAVCRERDILLIVDEVQMGMGRTGTLFAYEHYGITPDIMALAKPLAGGLPIGAVVVGAKVWPAIQPGDHAATFGGNHFVTGVANGVFDIIADPAFLADVAAKGAHLKGRLDAIAQKHACVKDVRGRGLIWGVEVDFPAFDAVEWFEREHILICAAGPSVIRFLPPLIVGIDDIDRAADALDTFLAGKDD